MTLWSVQVPLGGCVCVHGKVCARLWTTEALCVQESGCGRSRGVCSPVWMKIQRSLWTSVCVCVPACSSMFPSPKQSHPPNLPPPPITDAPDAQARIPRPRGDSQLYVNAAICRAAAPLPLRAAAGLPVWPPEGVSSKWAGNSVLADQGPAPSTLG